ncbi:hypothetical protein ACS0TY_031313 [Phlomoides rotata]
MYRLSYLFDGVEDRMRWRRTDVSFFRICVFSCMFGDREREKALILLWFCISLSPHLLYPRIIMRLISRNNAEICVVLEVIRRRTLVVFVFAFAILWWNKYKLDVSDDDCKDALKMDRVALARLCSLLQTLGGLRNSKYVSVQEKVVMFLSILAHHTKNRSVKFQFKKSGHTVSKYFHSVLHTVLKLHSLFLVEPGPVPEDSTDPRRQDSKGCLGVLDGTYTDVHVPIVDQARYRNQKG